MKNRERGQAIVILVFALVAMTAMAGLAIDAGRGYALRRQAQNAADAAAVAGTRLLATYISGCEDSEDNKNAEIWDAIVGIARNNGVDHDSPEAFVDAWYVDKNENILAPTGTNDPPNGATGVRVAVWVTEETTLLKILGQQNFEVSTEATAMAGPIREFAGGGLLPIAFPVQGVQGVLEQGLGFTMFDNRQVICSENGVYCPSDPEPASQRGWLIFDFIYNDEFNAGGNTDHPMNRVISTAPSNARLREYARTGSPHPLFAGTYGAPDTLFLDGDFIMGGPGARSSSVREICGDMPHFDGWLNQTVYLPLFDYVQQGDFMEENFDPGNQLSPSFRTDAQTNYYHLVGFLAATLTSCTGNSEIHGEFQYAVVGEGLIEPADGFQGNSSCSLEIMGISLWR